MHLRLLGRLATAPGTQDSTVDGEARSSTKAFSSATRHHAGAISAAIVLADATTLLNAASSMSFGLTFRFSLYPGRARVSMQVAR